MALIRKLPSVKISSESLMSQQVGRQSSSPRRRNFEGSDRGMFDRDVKGPEK